METKLWSALIGLSKTVDSNPKTENTDTIILDCLQRLRNHTFTQDLIDTVHKEKDKIIAKLQNVHTSLWQYK